MRINESLKNIIIIILILIIIGVSSLSIYLSLNNESKVNVDNKEPNNKKEEVNLSEKGRILFMNEIIPTLDKSQYTVSDYSKGKLNDVEKIKFALMVSNKLGQNVSYNDLLTISKKYLGDEGRFTPYDVNECFCGKKFYEYNSVDGIFYNKMMSHGHGEGSYFNSGHPNNYFVNGSVIKENGEIKTVEIKVRKSFVAIGDVVSGLYRFGTYEDALNGKNFAAELSLSFTDNDVIEHIRNNPNLYPIHTYLFEYVNDEYHLLSISIDK